MEKLSDEQYFEKYGRRRDEVYLSAYSPKEEKFPDYILGTKEIEGIVCQNCRAFLKLEKDEKGYFRLRVTNRRVLGERQIISLRRRVRRRSDMNCPACGTELWAL